MNTLNFSPGHAATLPRPPRNWRLLAVILLFHAVLVYALVNGLGRQIVHVVSVPLTVALISDAQAPAPTPALPLPKTSPPTPKAAPSQSSVPPINTSPASTTSSHAVSNAPASPAIDSRPASSSVTVACPNHRSVAVEMPKKAQEFGLSGQVVAEFTVAANGEVKDIAIVQSSDSVFNTAATRAIARYHCVGQGRDVRVRVPFVFKIY